MEGLPAWQMLNMEQRSDGGYDLCVALDSDSKAQIASLIAHLAKQNELTRALILQLQAGIKTSVGATANITVPSLLP